ncbi:MAG: cysteine desulfurase, partial [Pirellulales bacterium]|nr:cysteine desulfurase [Pirellulales bacterium]
MSLYLDHNATTPVAAEVLQAMADAERAFPGNPASQHSAGRAAKATLEDAREEISQLLGASPDDAVILTSGGTEANNLALLGLAGENPARILISAIEHPSVDAPAERLRTLGWDVVKIPVDSSGLLRREQLAQMLQTPTRLVSVIYGNNETGVLQPLEEIVTACHAAGAAVHTDAVQVAGKMPLDFSSLGVDAMTVTAHKFHGPRGIGALILRPGVRLAPRLFGGQQQGALRPGTESVALAIGLLEALRIWKRYADEIQSRLAKLRETFESHLCQQLPDVVIHSAEAPRLPHTSAIGFPGLNRQQLLMALDTAGIACSAGSACASGSTDPSPVLMAMGCKGDVLEGSLRFSFGRDQQEAEARA